MAIQFTISSFIILCYEDFSDTPINRIYYENSDAVGDMPRKCDQLSLDVICRYYGSVPGMMRHAFQLTGLVTPHCEPL